jgi:glycosyltransferase involved in cell wall biosynthesis
MACGVPAVGSDSGEIPNVVGDAGLVFREDDVSELREHLLSLLRDLNLRTRLAQKGRQRVLAYYTQAHVADQTYQVYQAVLDS